MFLLHGSQGLKTSCRSSWTVYVSYTIIMKSPWKGKYLVTILKYELYSQQDVWKLAKCRLHHPRLMRKSRSVSHLQKIKHFLTINISYIATVLKASLLLLKGNPKLQCWKQMHAWFQDSVNFIRDKNTLTSFKAVGPTFPCLQWPIFSTSSFQTDQNILNVWPYKFFALDAQFAWLKFHLSPGQLMNFIFDKFCILCGQNLISPCSVPCSQLYGIYNSQQVST